jgi:chloride channel 7
LNKFRLTALEHYWSAEQDGNYLTGALGSAGVAAFYCGFAAILVLFLAPKAAGSGLPEMKGYLNGCKITGMFGQMGWVRALGAIFTVSSGMPLGREGPMVSTGGQIGISIMDYLMKRFYMEKNR